MKALFSYVFSTMAGLCLIGGIAILSGGREYVDMLDDFINLLDSILDSKRKRHITGGILLSAALLFGGLAVTVVTIKNEEDYYEQD